MSGAEVVVIAVAVAVAAWQEQGWKGYKLHPPRPLDPEGFLAPG